MGAIAGKVMIRPRGDYDSSAVYDILDLVKYDNKPWLCKKNDTMGITPSTVAADYWMLLIDVSIANADTLDGHDSAYFAKASDVAKLVGDPIQVTFTAAGWSNAAPYTQTVSATGITENDAPIPLFVDNGTNSDDSKNKLKAYGYISYFDSGAGTITATCKYNKPEVDVTVAMKGV